MPELPEVEALSRDLAARLAGEAIAAFEVVAINALKTFDPPPEALAGALIDDVGRRGKYVDIQAAGLHLVVHLAKAGWVRWLENPPAKPPRGKYAPAARLMLASGPAVQFTEAGTRKSLAIWLVGELVDVPVIAALGPEPLDEDFTVERLAEILTEAGRSQIKGVLRSQGTIAGIGNAYSDEILHAARLSPFAPAATVDPARLHKAITATIADALAATEGLGAAELKDAKRAAMRVHGREGQACDVCGDTIASVSFADSSLQYCPGCQTGGKPLADRRMSRLLK